MLDLETCSERAGMEKTLGLRYHLYMKFEYVRLKNAATLANGASVKRDVQKQPEVLLKDVD